MSTDKKRKKRAATPALNHRQKKRLQELKRRRNRVLVLLLVVILSLVIAGYLLVSKLGSLMRPKADQTTLSVDSKGKIRLEEVIDLSETDGNKGDLKDFVKSAIDKYNAKSKKDVRLLRFGNVDGKAYVETEYPDDETYQKFTGYQIFSGSIKEARKEGYTFSDALLNVKDGIAKDGDYADNASVQAEDDLKVLILRENIRVKVDGEIVYVSSASTRLESENIVKISPADGNVDASELVYIIYK